MLAWMSAIILGDHLRKFSNATAVKTIINLDMIARIPRSIRMVKGKTHENILIFFISIENS